MLFTCISCVSNYIRVKAIITDILYYEEVFYSYLVVELISVVSLCHYCEIKLLFAFWSYDTRLTQMMELKSAVWAPLEIIAAPLYNY